MDLEYTSKAYHIAIKVMGEKNKLTSKLARRVAKMRSQLAFESSLLQIGNEKDFFKSAIDSAQQKEIEFGDIVQVVVNLLKELESRKRHDDQQQTMKQSRISRP